MIKSDVETSLNTKRYNSLDALRGLAALMLLVFHVKGIPNLEITGELGKVVSFFGAGVPLFYALSAFSLMVGYHDILQSPGGLVHFYVRRVFRILPLFYTVLIFWLFIRKFYFNTNTTFSIFSLNYLCVFGLIPGQHEGLVWASWSIGVEVLFYIVFPLALIASRTLASSFFVFLATLAISTSSQETLATFKDIAPSFSYMAISTQIVFFGAGLFAYRLGEYLRNKISGVSQIKRRVCAEVIFLLGMVFVLLYWLTPTAGWAGSFHLGPQMLAFAWILILSPISIYGKLKMLAIRPLERAGKLSFSLYLLNPPVIFFMSQTGLFKKIYAKTGFPNLAFGMCFLIALSVLWIISQLTYNLIEQKGILLGKQFLDKKNARASKEALFLTPVTLISISKRIVILAVLPWLIWGGLAILPKTNEQSKPIIAQSLKPKTDKLLTKKLWDSLCPKDASAADENLKLIDCGIRIHPGGDPKSATFLLTGKFKKVQLVCFINELPATALKDPNAGIAGVEILMDEKSQGHRLVDRNVDQTYNLDLSQTDELKIVVDCSNGVTNWDWVNIAIK